MEPDWNAAAAVCLMSEGFFPYPYDDAYYPARRYTGGPIVGTLTIGYGETDRAYIDAHWNGVSEPEARARYMSRAPGYWSAFQRYLRTELSRNQGAACVCMAYNAGSAGMHLYAPALLAAINRRDFAYAAEIWKTSIIMRGSRWEAGLRRRRAAESRLFATPDTAKPGGIHMRGLTIVNVGSTQAVDLAGHPEKAEPGWGLGQAPIDAGIDQLYGWGDTDGDGAGIVRHLVSGLVWDIFDGSILSGTQLILWNEHGGPNQRFYFREQAPGSFIIEAKESGLVLGVRNGSQDPGAPVIQEYKNGTRGQFWTGAVVEGRPFF